MLCAPKCSAILDVLCINLGALNESETILNGVDNDVSRRMFEYRKIAGQYDSNLGIRRPIKMSIKLCVVWLLYPDGLQRVPES